MHDIKKYQNKRLKMDLIGRYYKNYSDAAGGRIVQFSTNYILKFRIVLLLWAK